MALFWTPEAIQDHGDIYNYIESASANGPWRSIAKPLYIERCVHRSFSIWVLGCSVSLYVAANLWYKARRYDSWVIALI